MAKLGRLIVEALVLEYGRDEVLRRLAHPFWFQSLGAVMGMDWHSSGITTSVLGALKRGLAPVEWELGIHVCGGRGKQSRKTPDELIAVGDRTGLDGNALARSSRLTAKVDSALVQDGFQLYLHGFVVADDGKWTVVQQGMNPDAKQARRYHWLSEGLTSFVDDPHSAIDGVSQGEIINLADRRAAASRATQLELVASPAQVLACLPRLSLPAHHDVRHSDVSLRRLRGTLELAANGAPRDYADLLLTPGMGAQSIRALSLVAEVVHGAPCRFTDPARFSLAHGGKDAHPYPVPLKVYDHTLQVMRAAIERAKIGQSERLAAIRRLDTESRRLEGPLSPSEFDAFVDEQRRDSHALGGMSVFGPAKKPPVEKTSPQKLPVEQTPKKRQLSLF